MKDRVRVAITGAAGQIGYALLFRIASGQMFGENIEVELSLLELPDALPALHGVAMELDDCAFPLLKSIRCTSDLKEAMDGVHWALLVGSVPRKQGMERSDLLEINGGIFTKQGQALNNYAASDVQVFVVGNPCNTNALIAMENAPDIPKKRFNAMTMLDQLRGEAQLSQKAGVPVTAISNMIIWGNHSATQYPDFYNARINGKSAASLIDESWLKETFVSTVQQRGAAILKARGLSSAASAANAIIRGVNSLVMDTADNQIFSMCRHSDGQYGVDEGLIFSFPCRRTQGNVEIVDGFELNEYGMEKFNATLNELRQERDIVRSLGLIK